MVGMQRPEITLRKPWLRAWPGQVSLVEPSLGSTPGVPDTWVSYHGERLHLEGWVEFKLREPNGSFQIRPKQRLWHREYLDGGGHCAAFCVVSDKGFCLIPSRRGLADPTTEGAACWSWESLQGGEDRARLPRLLELCFERNSGRID